MTEPVPSWVYLPDPLTVVPCPHPGCTVAMRGEGQLEHLDAHYHAPGPRSVTPGPAGPSWSGGPSSSPSCSCWRW